MKSNLQEEGVEATPKCLDSTSEERLFFMGTITIRFQRQEDLEKRRKICHTYSQPVIWRRGPQ